MGGLRRETDNHRLQERKGYSRWGKGLLPEKGAVRWLALHRGGSRSRKSACENASGLDRSLPSRFAARSARAILLQGGSRSRRWHARELSPQSPADGRGGVLRGRDGALRGCV